MIKVLNALLFCLLASSCNSQTDTASDGASQEQILETYLKNGAWNHHYLTKEWQEWIDRGLQKDSTIAYLWQQKALPFWKQKKYSLAIKYYDKAVALDRQVWLSRLAFLKCIFAKDYEGALEDIRMYRDEFGSIFEQDHPLEFYEGICYLQLNQYDHALSVLKASAELQEKEYGASWVPYLDRYYLAIAYYETGDYQSAIAEFDKVLKEYAGFSDAQYYQSICLHYLGHTEQAQALIATGKSNFEKGRTFSEDSNIYETYPYQLTWQWQSIGSLFE